MKTRLIVTLMVVVGMLSMVPACSDHAHLGLLQPKPAGDDAEHERLRRMQMVRVLSFRNGQPAGTGQPPQGGDVLTTPIPFDITPSALESLLLSSVCNEEIELSPLCGTQGTCLNGACRARKELCVAQHLLDAARVRAAPVHIQDQLQTDGSFYHDFLIPPQSVATNAGLARIAFRDHLPIAMARAFGTLRTAVGLELEEEGDTCTPDELKQVLTPTGVVTLPPDTPPPAGASTVGAFLANVAVESYHVFREAALKAAEFSLAVADAQRSDPSLATQVSHGVVGAELSRLAAAHILVGGDEGLLGNTDNEARAGLCTAPDLTAQAQQAISIFRESGVSPAAIMALPGRTDAITLDTLLEGPVTDGSVKQRLGERWNYDFSAPPAGIPANQKIADYFHLEPQDFAQGREYLAQEITAFSRSLTAQMDAPPSPNPAVIPRKLFVATARPPKPVPTSYYGALARYDSTPHPALLEPLFMPSDNPAIGINQAAAADAGVVNLAGGIDAALTQAAAILSNQNQISDTAARADAINPLATLLAANERSGRFILCRTTGDSSSDSVATIAAGYSKDDGIRLMLGEDGLRCAVEGSIEGAPCSDDFEALTLAKVENDYYELQPIQIAGFDKASYGAAAVRPSASLTGQRAYLVRPDGASRSPGSFKQLGGLTMVDGLLGACTDVPIIPEIDQRVADIMAPNRKWCTSSQVSCAGTDFDARLPLEDELSGDQDGIESSWKHYLALAKQAATEADLLGQDYLQKGLEFEQNRFSTELRDDQKEELAEDKGVQAINELQDICGTAVDPIKLLKLLSTGTDQNDLNLVRDASPCPTGNECKADYQCIAGQCVLDLAAWLKKYQGDGTKTTDRDASDLRRLADCISGGSVVDLVHLGSKSRPVCVWREMEDHRRLCEGASSSHPCPDLSSDKFCGNLRLPIPPRGVTLEPVAISDALELMDTTQLPTILPSGASDMDACDAIRELRGRRAGNVGTTDIDQQLLNKIRGTAGSRFHPVSVRNLARRIGFEARYGDYAAITLDGGTAFSTGSPWVGKSMAGHAHRRRCLDAIFRNRHRACSARLYRIVTIALRA